MPVSGRKRKLASSTTPHSKKRKTRHQSDDEEVDEYANGEDLENGSNRLDSGSDNEEMEEEESEDELINGSASQRTGERGGTIREVVLENFMCHKHLRTCLKPNINFLTGPNGSKLIHHIINNNKQ